MPTSRGIRKLQTHDAQGQPAESESRFDIPLNRATMATGVIEVALRFITPLHPRATDDHGILSYDEPGVGSGELILELNDAAITDITERVRLGEDRPEGQLDPHRIQHTASAQTTPVGRNPSWLIVLGALATLAAASLLSLSLASVIVDDVGGSVRAALMGLLLGTAGVLTVITGKRRRSRWILARAASYR